jgi:hypothetical protein
VLLLASLESLIALPLPTLGGGAGTVVLFPRPAPPVVCVSATFRVAVVPRVALAFSTILVRTPAASPVGAGAEGLSGETGRARFDFPGEVVGRFREAGKVRELADRGERIREGGRMARGTVRDGGPGAPRTSFLRLPMSSFSLSIIISSLGMSAKEQ